MNDETQIPASHDEGITRPNVLCRFNKNVKILDKIQNG